MNEFKGRIDNAKDRLQGEMNEAAGKILGNEQLELKGKLQIGKADLKDKIEEKKEKFEAKIDIKHAVNEVKEDIAGKINDRIDKKNKKKI